MNLKLAKAEFKKHAKEDLELKEIDGTIYAFGSELACLRLFYVYHTFSKYDADVSFSKPMNSWYFRFECL